MKLKLLILVFCFASITLCQAQNNNPVSLGIGFAFASKSAEFGSDRYANQIYDDENFTKKVNKEEIFPYFDKPDYSLYHFICLEKTDSYYKILVNDNKVAFIPNNKDFLFKTWETIIMGGSVARIDKKQPIYERYDELNQTVKNSCEFETMEVGMCIEINGEYWISVEFAGDCVNVLEDSKDPKYGWIKWRTKDKLLVELFLLC